MSILPSVHGLLFGNVHPLLELPTSKVKCSAEEHGFGLRLINSDKHLLSTYCVHTKDTMVDKIHLVPVYGGLILVETQINNGVSDRNKCCEVRG